MARQLLVAGVPLTDVADLLGHASLNTTRIYTHPSAEERMAAVSKIEVEW
jgi:site-specific recombinase XerD